MRKRNQAAIYLGIIIISLIIVNIMSKGPRYLGVDNGFFKKCPKSPNCISTQSDPSDEGHYMEPIKYSTTKEEAYENILEVINSMKRTKIITKSDSYIHAEFRIKILIFVDDVEFYIDDENKVIHFRSASRVGYSDTGLNRRRMEDFVVLFNELISQPSTSS
ncbi:MAG: DUF1499 domain-containing protein [Halobacteriota archaeon]|nr:DUF1499 domain-containing protein [Halobacteriota archaeon]